MSALHEKSPIFGKIEKNSGQKFGKMENKVIVSKLKKNGGSMTMNIDRENNKFRVKTQQFNTEWIPDTLENRKTTVSL